MFKAGEIVYLKVGSPPLVVGEDALDNDLVMVEWFSGAEVKRETFHPGCLLSETPEMERMRLQRRGKIRFPLTETDPVTGEIRHVPQTCHVDSDQALSAWSQTLHV